MKAQLSMELLIILSLFLGVVLISLASLSHLRERWDGHLAFTAASLALADISNAADEACILGEGNIRAVALPPAPYALSLSGSRTLVANASGKSLSRVLLCDVDVFTAAPGKNAIVEGNGKTVSITSG